MMHPLSLLKEIPPSNWKAILRKSFNRADRLADFLELDSEKRSRVSVDPDFPVLVPYRIAEKMEKNSLTDPLVLQFVPLLQETEEHPDFTDEPVCDSAFRKSGKLLHKYDGRVLLVCTSACAMHCRYCFRQNFDYVNCTGFEEEIRQIAEDSTIREVILSGGDPLSLSNETLRNLLDRLASISHLKRIRFHSRFMIGIPERIDPEFLEIIRSVPLQVIFVIHCNHPRELDPEILDRLKLLRMTGCPILNQAVLLRGVNDNPETLIELCLALSDEGILPYYLHLLDKVRGAARFDVSEEEGRALIEEIAKKLPGYAVPKFVCEIPGQPNKTSLY